MNFRTGDHISTPGRFGIRHHGIVDRRGRGGPKVIHASKTEGMRVVSPLLEFSGGASVSLVRRAERGERLSIADRARARLGEPYSLTGLAGSNCEHVANEATTGVASSPQLQMGVAFLSGIALGFGLVALFKPRSTPSAKK